MGKIVSFIRRYQVWIGVVLVLVTYIAARQYAAISVSQENAAEENVIPDKKVAITFDDGPNPLYTPKLLDGLKERDVKATFFVIGSEAELYPDIIGRMASEGHEIGNHTYSHVDLCCLDYEQIEYEVCHTNEIIEAVTGYSPTYIRPPFGAWSKELGDKTGMIEVLWDVDPRDWNTSDTGTVITRVLKNVDDRNIILFHDSSKSSVDAALAVIDELLEQGYSFVGVDEILFD